MKKILLAPNSFKECAGSVKIAELLEKYLNDSFQCKTHKLPISDGGDGFLEVCKTLFNLEVLTASASTPYDNSKIDVKYGYDKDKKQMYIESAEIVGVDRIPLEKRHPLLLNSKGLGGLIKTICESGLNVEKVIIGLGGTGTNDLGLGFCSVFGMELFNHSGKKLDILPENYKDANNLFWSRPELPFKIEMILDVDNPLMGSYGATKIFARQKGATKKDIDILESGFNQILNLLKFNKINSPIESLSGAGGGLAAGLQLFFDAIPVSAESFILNEIIGKIDINEFDYILTGEGAFDKQTFLKKGASIIIDQANAWDKEIFLVCGSIDFELIKKSGNKIIPIELNSFFENSADSIKNIEIGLKLAAEKIKDYLGA